MDGGNTTTGGFVDTGNVKKSLSNLTQNGFIQHVTRFDRETKSELSNLMQYLVIAIIPIYLLNKTLNKFLPEYDETKGNIELLGEVIINSICLLLGIYVIHRIVCYLPTFSGENLAEINFMNIVLMIVFLGMNSENGKKINLVYERLFGDKVEEKQEKKDGSVVKVSQPLSGNGGMQAPIPTHQASRADYLGQHDQMTAPQNNVVQQIHENPASQMGGGMPNVGGNGFGGDASPGMIEPMAANSAFGSAFSNF